MRIHHRPALLLLLASLVVAPAERAAAGTAIGESIWDVNNARDRALQSVPAGAQIGSTSCQTVEVGTGNYHYICRITYTDPAPQTPTTNR
jgi:hypothetical protein